MGGMRRRLLGTSSTGSAWTGAKAVLDRACVGLFLLIWGAALVKFGPGLANGERWLATVGGLLGGYLLADLLAGAVHWMADRFFEPRTPLLGPMLIAPFREHHDDALDITRHDFFEVSGNNALVTLPVIAVIALLPRPVDVAMHVVVALGLSLTLSLFLTNQFHSWAHSPSPPRWVRPLHAWGLILTPARHARHHRAEHDRAYCVTSGWLNPLLDRIGVFDRLEGLVNAIRPGADRASRR